MYSAIIAIAVLTCAVAGLLMYQAIIRKRYSGYETRFMAMIDASSEGIFVVDRQGIITFASPSVEAFLGYEPHSILEKSFLDSVVSDHREAAEKLFKRVVDNNQKTVSAEFKIINRKGQCRDLSITCSNYLSEETIRGLVINVRDITDHVVIEETLKKSQKKYRSLYDNAMVGLLTTDLETGLVIATNDMGYKAFGYDSKYDFVGSSILDHYSDVQSRDTILNELKKKGEINNKEVLFKRKNGSVFWGEISSKISSDKGTIESVLIDVTKAKEAEEHVYQLTFYDPLTGLPNRDMFQNRIQTEIIKSQRLAILCIGIDKFKNINDMYGPWIGDNLLKVMAKKLKKVYFNKDMVARFAGDQFMVLLTEIGHKDDDLNVYNIDKILQKTRSLFSEPVILDDNEIEVTSSIGISLFPNDGVNASILMKNSEAAMYIAKESGRNSSFYYDADLNRKMMNRLKVEKDLGKAINKSQFIAHYQPKVDGDGTILGMESLIRWDCPGREGLVPPFEFIPLAEKNGMIVHIGNIILRKACEENVLLQKLGFAPKCVAVNLSPYQFSQPDLIETIKKVVNETGLDPKWLELEITESGIMKNERESIRKLSELSEFGIRISIDDFGTGYSSLSKLKLYPIHTLKIDKSFVDDLPGDPLSATIAVSIIDLAHNLGFKVVAEGVETREQLEFLKENGCDQYQGYLFYKPLPFEDFKRSLVVPSDIIEK